MPEGKPLWSCSKPINVFLLLCFFEDKIRDVLGPCLRETRSIEGNQPAYRGTLSGFFLERNETDDL